MQSALSQLLTALLTILVFIAQSTSTATDSDAEYTAGVVEFRPVVAGMSSEDMLAEHLAAYEELVRSPEAQGTDIIVFPEGTLNSVLQPTLVPDPTAFPEALCDDYVYSGASASVYAEFLVRLSCLARETSIYLVINLTEMEHCESEHGDPRPCAPSGLNIYNTNVVLDRQGRVVARYRKWNLYQENKNTTLEPQLVTFETDFGVRFGVFTCFDILFHTPAQDLVARGIHNFVTTSMFYSELPFLTAVQLQQSWAWANNVTLLAAGASFPQAGCTGSGIYVGQRGSLESLMVGGSGERRLLVARVPKVVSTKSTAPPAPALAQVARDRQTGLRLMQDYQMEAYQTELLDLQRESSVSRRLCDNGDAATDTGDDDKFCCEFHVEGRAQATPPNSFAYRYRLAVFNGDRRYEQLAWSSLQICAVVACTDDTLLSCGKIFEDDVHVAADFVFSRIDVAGVFRKQERQLLMPNSVDEALYPLPADSVVWTVDDQGSSFAVRYATLVDRDNILTFGIYGNYYDSRSRAPPANALAFGWVVLLLGVLLAPTSL